MTQLMDTMQMIQSGKKVGMENVLNANKYTFKEIHGSPLWFS